MPPEASSSPASSARFFDDDIDADIEAIEIELEQLSPAEPAAPGKSKPKRAPLSPELPRTEVRHEPILTTCGCGCGCAMRRIGEDVAEKLDYTPGTFTVQRHIRGKWVCAACQTITMAPMPAQVIDKGLPTAGLLGQVLVAKYADHQPLYRQQVIFGRARLAIPRSTLAAWVGAAGVALAPVAAALKAAMLERRVLYADETPVAMLKPGAGKTHRAYLWAYCAGAFEPIRAVVYDFAQSRSGQHARDFLGEWKGALVCDDFSGYEASFERGVTELGCLAHARRKFFELHATNKIGAGGTVTMCRILTAPEHQPTGARFVSTHSTSVPETARPSCLKFLVDPRNLFPLVYQDVESGVYVAEVIALPAQAEARARVQLLLDNNALQAIMEPDLRLLFRVHLWAAGATTYLSPGFAFIEQLLSNPENAESKIRAYEERFAPLELAPRGLADAFLRDFVRCESGLRWQVGVLFCYVALIEHWNKRRRRDSAVEDWLALLKEDIPRLLVPYFLGGMFAVSLSDESVRLQRGGKTVADYRQEFCSERAEEKNDYPRHLRNRAFDLLYFLLSPGLTWEQDGGLASRVLLSSRDRFLGEFVTRLFQWERAEKGQPWQLRINADRLEGRTRRLEESLKKMEAVHESAPEARPILPDVGDSIVAARLRNLVDLTVNLIDNEQRAGLEKALAEYHVKWTDCAGSTSGPPCSNAKRIVTYFCRRAPAVLGPVARNRVVLQAAPPGAARLRKTEIPGARPHVSLYQALLVPSLVAWRRRVYMAVSHPRPTAIENRSSRKSEGRQRATCQDQREHPAGTAARLSCPAAC